MKVVTTVCSETQYSCGLACIESILADNGITRSQNDMLRKFLPLFPKWKEHPGLLSAGDFELIFEKSGLPVSVKMPRVAKESINMIRESHFVGAILTTAKGWEDSSKSKLIHNSHALRLIDISEFGMKVMNPYRCPNEGVVEEWSWKEVQLRETQPFIFVSKQEESSS